MKTKNTVKKETLILAIDQGTTSSRAIVFDSSANVCALAQQEFKQYYPHNGWVEHDPEELWQSTLAVARQALLQAEQKGGQVEAIGITNQRETSLLWERDSGAAVYNAIVWQDRRTAQFCQHLKAAGAEKDLSQRSGLLLDPYFSASKLSWLLENVTGAKLAAVAGKLAFGTIDSFLLWRLTGGKVHATDATNASRTNLYNIHRNQWDADLLKLFDVPQAVLPQVMDCAANFGITDKGLFGREIPILGIAGDQQAAAIGQCCFSSGETKSTYGTGCFVLTNTGKKALMSQHKLLTTIAARIKGETTYALEGSIFMAGALVQWLRDELGLIASADETEALAKSVESNQGVYLVPAFTGLGAPHWNPDARGALLGLTRGSNKAHIVRAALESVAYQTQDLLAAMASDGCAPSCLRVDGGMTANNWLMQFLADTIAVEVERPVITETTALGAAFLAGMQLGLYSDFEAMRASWRCSSRFEPSGNTAIRARNSEGWSQAINSVLNASRPT